MPLAEPGVPHSRALDRARRVSHARYDLHLSLPNRRTESVQGRLTIAFDLSDASAPLVVDFAPAGTAGVSSLRVNGAEQDIPSPGHIGIPAAPLRPGRNEIDVVFTAGDGPLNRRDTLLYSVFVPARAHEAFPCFDQPDLKARWTLTLDAPAHWSVVSNGGAVHVESLAEHEGVPRTSTRFGETKPLPTYLFAFAAGVFQVEDAWHDGRAMRLFHAGADPELVSRNRNVVFDAHAGALRWLERYTDVAYPFDTFDIVLIPAFQFSGMEHPGAIFYNAGSLLLGPSATRQQEMSRASLIAHETAHLWFGDLVTMRWFDDVWMKEVCANFMAAKIVNPQFAEFDHDLQFFHTHYPGAYEVDRTAGTHPIRQPLGNLADAGSLYGAIIYLKSPIVFRQLELRLGEDGLREVLSEYLRRYAFANASWPELVELLAGRGVPGVPEWSRAWIDSAGRPHIRTLLEVEDGGVRSARLELVPGHDGMAQRLDIAIGRSGSIAHESVWFTGTCALPALIGGAVPDFVLPNGRGLGYGQFDLDHASLDWLLAHLRHVPDALTRGAAWLTLWEAMLAGNAAPAALLRTALETLEAEDNQLNLHRLLTGVERLFWVLTDARSDVATRLRIEALLRALMTREATTATRAALFATFHAVAMSPDSLAWLEALCTRASTIDGLPLAPADLVPVALGLAIRGVRDLQALTEDLSPLLDAEKRGFLAFVAPALSVDASVRERFVSGLADPAARRPEPWVVEALRWLHHPLHEFRSVQYLDAGLALLEDVTRTGDIFLPKRWLDAMLAGHRSAAAAQVVRRFLDTRPSHYPATLRQMILASADPLFRMTER